MDKFSFILFLNGIVESCTLLILWNVLQSERFSAVRRGVTFALMCGASIVIASLESSFLPLSFLLLFLCTFAGYGKIVGWKNVLLNTVFSLIALMYLQVTLMWFFPSSFFTSGSGMLCINSAVLMVAFLLKYLAWKMNWSETYQKNLKTTWLFIVLLSVPTIVLMQMVASNLEKENRLLIICLLLLQFSYLLVLIVAFLIFNQKQERRRIKQTKEAIEMLNLYLDESKKKIHDFNKHINYLRSVVSTQSSDQNLKQIVDDYCKDILTFSEQEEIKLQIEDPMYRALLFRRQLQAEKLKIDFHLEGTTILPVFPIPNYRFVEIFDNLLDNAFECASTLRGEKWVKISLQVNSLPDGITQHLLYVQNPYEELNFSAIANQRKHTSKGGNHQGIGLQNVARIISESNGNLILNHDNGIFTVKVIYEVKA